MERREGGIKEKKNVKSPELSVKKEDLRKRVLGKTFFAFLGLYKYGRKKVGRFVPEPVKRVVRRLESKGRQVKKEFEEEKRPR